MRILRAIKTWYLKYFYAPGQMPKEWSEDWGYGASGTGGSGG